MPAQNRLTRIRTNPKKRFIFYNHSIIPKKNYIRTVNMNRIASQNGSHSQFITFIYTARINKLHNFIKTHASIVNKFSTDHGIMCVNSIISMILEKFNSVY